MKSANQGRAAGIRYDFVKLTTLGDLPMKMQKGFTLIELMIVIAILGILIAIALPAYQDYSIRTKNTECLNIAAALKLAIAEYRQSEGSFPATEADAGYVFTPSKYCLSVASVNNAITATTRATGGDVVYTLTGTANSSAITWVCASSVTVAHPGWVPKECRN